MMKEDFLKILNSSKCLNQEQLLEYLAGETDARQTHEIEEHLADCSLCTEALEGLSIIENKDNIPTITGELKQYAHRQLKRRRPIRRPQNYFIGLIALVIFILLLIIFLYYFYFFSILK